MRLAVGVDTGGTFTDLVAVDIDDPSAVPISLKVPSTPRDPSEAVEVAIGALKTRLGDDLILIELLAHGTTVATNALLQDRFPLVGMITNRGFRDIVEIARQRRPDLYDLDVPKPTPIAPRHLRREIDGRMGPSGEEWEPLDETLAAEAVRDLVSAGVEAIAVCLLHSYVDGIHERRIRDVVLTYDTAMPICISSEVMPEWREYERFSTTLVNAALMPVVATYLRRLVERTANLGVTTLPLIMQSNGGLASVERVSRMPMTSLYSGPSAGVIGAAAIAQSVGHGDVITLDVGGTSSDVCLVEDGRPAFLSERSVAGHAVKVDSLAVQSIGAGGGSIITVDLGGFVQVGPQSAGADPGPACYGRGGTRPTITDANVVLGRLDPSLELGGTVTIDPRNAAEAMHPIATALGCGVEEAASTAITVMTASIARAIKLISLDRGHDPRGFSLVAFGGAGAMHAADVAQELGMDFFVIPPRPGVLCALGLLGAPQRADFRRTLLVELDGNHPESQSELMRTYLALETQSRAHLSEQNLTADQLEYHWAADMSFGGQDHELTVPVADYERSDMASVLAERFRALYHDAYGYVPPDSVVRIVNSRITASGAALLDVTGLGLGAKNSASPTRQRDVYFAEHGGWISTDVVSSPTIGEGSTLSGPAIVQQDDSTIVIPPGWTGKVVKGGGLIVRRSGRE